MTRAPFLLLGALALSCGSSTGDWDDASGGSGASGGAGGSANAGQWAVEALPYAVTAGPAIESEPGKWTFVGFPDSQCANGTSTGIAVNTLAKPEGLLIFMQGGGACWDAASCLLLKSSVHLEDEVGEATVLAEAGSLGGLFEHDNQANPFENYAYVYMPYCTGDLHVGSGMQTYDAGLGPVTIAHQGGNNVAAYLKRLVPTFVSVPRVVVSGVSAGGFGATLNWWRYQGAFAGARVDIWDDAGLLVDAPDARWATMVSNWSMVLPPGCAACAERLSAWLPFLGQHMVAPRRYALSGYLNDTVIGGYFGLTGGQIETQLLALREAAADNQKTFFLSGTQHSVIGEGATTVASDGSTLLPWILQYALDDPQWSHAGP